MYSQYRVQVNSFARQKIYLYIDAYKEKFRVLYSDTGLGIATEKVIMHQYIVSADAFADAIYDSIFVVLSGEKVLGCSYNNVSNTYAVTMPIQKRRIFLTYQEDNKNNIRILVDIEIMKK